MKKTGVLLLALVLCLLSLCFASAEGGPVGRSGAIAAYVDGDGHIYLTGKAEAINKAPADSIVSADAYRVLFLSRDAANDSSDLYMIDMAAFQESVLAKDVHTAILAGDDTAYCVTNASRNQLIRLDLNTKASTTAYTAQEPIDRLYMSAEGLVVQLVDQAGNLLYAPETGTFEPYANELPRSGIVTDGYEVYLTDAGDLYFRNGFNYASEFLDGDVLAYTRMNNIIYYLSHAGSAVRLMEYDPSAQSADVVLTPETAMENQLTASANTLFMLGKDNTVYTVDVKKGTLAPFKRYDDFSGYGIPAGSAVDGLQIEGMSGQLNVYARLVEKTAKPDFSFIEFETETEVADPVLKLIDKLSMSGEATAWDELKPVEQYTTLSRGSRGDAVRAIQQPLYDLGYYDYYVDGIFGPRTENAIRILQDDLGLTVNGVANADLQRTILSGTLKAYDPYVELARGKRGMRVTRMQESLRDLGYLADAADGIFGPRTQKAVQLFQKENGLNVSDKATRETLKLLYSDRASRCSSYIDLYPGDTGYRVRELNNRLRELYYLESNVGSRYTSETTSAVRMFQRTAGLRETGQATVPVLKALFAHDAPEAPGYITLSRGDRNSRVERLQRRLKELGYYNDKVDGYFGKSTKKAVALFQRKVGLKPTGVATVRTQQLLFDPDAPVYVPPTVIGDPVISLDYYDRIEDNTYCVSDNSSSSGYITFSWFAEGDVKNYNVMIYDEDGNIILDQETMLTDTGVSVATLPYDVLYTIEVTAYPMDDDEEHITYATASFKRIEIPVVPEIGTIGNPEISVEPVARVENGISYVQPGNIVFHWKADGDVASYYWEIRDESDNIFLSANTTDEQTTISTTAINQGEQYAIFVYAIPTNGTIDNARVKFLRFSLPVVELPSPDPTPVPTPTPTPEPTPEPTPTPEAAFEAPAPVNIEQGEETPAADAAEPEQGEETPAAEAETTEQGEETPAAEAETTEQGEETPAADSEAPEAVEEQQSAVSAPALSFSSVVDVVDDISLIDSSADELTLSFPADGNVDSYEVAVYKDDQLLTSTVVDKNTEALSVHTAVMEPDAVYTLNVVAIPEGGAASDGEAASAQFALDSYAGAQAEPQPEVEPELQPEAEPEVQPEAEPEPQPEVEPELQPEAEPEVQPEAEPEPQPEAEPEPQPEAEPEPQPEAEPEPQPEAEPEVQPETEIGTVGVPSISLDSIGYDDNGAAIIDSGNDSLPMSWYAEGDVAYYHVEIRDMAGSPVGYCDTEDTTYPVSTANIPDDVPYLLYVVAVPSGGTTENGQGSSAMFVVKGTESEPEPEVVPEPEPEYVEPEPEYTEPEPEYTEPEPEYVEPEPEYVEPEPEYTEPEPEYAEPEPEYTEPEPEYTEPEPEYVEPEQEYTEPEPEPEGIEYMGYTWSSTIDAGSDSDRITIIQQRLQELGWLSNGFGNFGTLDDATASAIADFQSYVNSNSDLYLPTIDTSSPTIDVDTLSALLGDSAWSYANPSPASDASDDGGYEEEGYDEGYDDYEEEDYYDESEDY